MPYDPRKESASRKTLKEYAPEKVTISGTAVVLIRQTVDVPGYFVEDRLESWSAEIGAKALNLGGMFGRGSEVIAHAATRRECVAKAKKALAKRKS